jgi:hypothetical protein
MPTLIVSSSDGKEVDPGRKSIVPQAGTVFGQLDILYCLHD